MTWEDMLKELQKNSPDSFETNLVVEANVVYDTIGGKDIRVSNDFDTIIIEFTGKYIDKYSLRIRVWSDSQVTASVDVKGFGYFDFPVNLTDYHFDERVEITPCLRDFKTDLKSLEELRQIYDWIFDSYRRLL